MTPYLLLIALIPALCNSLAVTREVNFDIKTNWDGTPIANTDDAARVSLGATADNELEVKVSARFYNSPKGIPHQDGQCPQRATTGLWPLEIVEVFLLNADNQYLQLQFSPRGQYKVFLLSDRRNYELTTLPLNVTVDNDCDQACDRWTVSAFIPIEYLPPNINRMNAHAQHGPNNNVVDPGYENLVFESLYPVDPAVVTKPDFHNLEAFEEVDLSQIGFRQPETPSYLWEQIINGQRRFNVSYPLFYQNDCLEVPTGYRAQATLTRVSGIPDRADRVRVQFNVTAENGPRPQPTFLQGKVNQPREAFFVSFGNTTEERQTRITITPAGEYQVERINQGAVPGVEQDQLQNVDCRQRVSEERGRSWACDFEIPVKFLPKRISSMQLAHLRYPTNNPEPQVVSVYCPNGQGNSFNNLQGFGCEVDKRSLVHV